MQPLNPPPPPPPFFFFWGGGPFFSKPDFRDVASYCSLTLSFLSFSLSPPLPPPPILSVCLSVCLFPPPPPSFSSSSRLKFLPFFFFFFFFLSPPPRKERRKTDRKVGLLLDWINRRCRYCEKRLIVLCVPVSGACRLEWTSGLKKKKKRRRRRRKKGPKSRARRGDETCATTFRAWVLLLSPASLLSQRAHGRCCCDRVSFTVWHFPSARPRLASWQCRCQGERVCGVLSSPGYG